MCEVSQENMNVESGDEKEKTLENKWMDEKTLKIFFLGHDCYSCISGNQTYIYDYWKW